MSSYASANTDIHWKISDKHGLHCINSYNHEKSGGISTASAKQDCCLNHTLFFFFGPVIFEPPDIKFIHRFPPPIFLS